MIKLVENIENTEGERLQKLSYDLGTDNGKIEDIISCSHLVDHLEATANEENETNDELYKLKALFAHQRPPKAPSPILKRCKYNVLVK